MVGFNDNMSWFEEWLRNNQALIYKMANGVSIYGMDTEDIVQELSLICMHAAETFRFDAGVKFSTYAVTSMRNRIYEMGRKTHTRQIEFEMGMRSIDEEQGEDHRSKVQKLRPWREISVEEVIEGNERLRAVGDAFMALSPRNREIVFALCDGRSQTEVAQAYHLSQPLVCKILKNFRADVLRRIGD